MGRSRPPIESVVAISVLLVALLVGAGVVIGSRLGGDHDQFLASADAPSPDPPDPFAPPPEAEPPGSTTSTSQPSDPPADPGRPASPTTTAPVDTPTPTTSPRRGNEPVAECTELASQSSWRRTGDRAPLDAGAGTSAGYVEVVTNQASSPCRLRIDRCATTAVLVGPDGSPADTMPPACTDAVTEVVLAPGEARREELTVAFPVPPGSYRVQVDRLDGTSAALPVVLDDRVPACAAGALAVAVEETDLFRRLEDVVDDGLDVGLEVTGADVACTLRVAESRITLLRGEEQVEIVDDTERWSAVEPGSEVRTHALVRPVDLEPGDHEGTVTLVLADGAELEAPFRLLLG